MSKKLKKTLALILSLVTVFSAAFTSMAEVEVVEAEPVVVTETETDQVIPAEPVTVIADVLDSAVSLEESVSVETVEEVAETESGTDYNPGQSSVVSAELLGSRTITISSDKEAYDLGEPVKLTAHITDAETDDSVFFFVIGNDGADQKTVSIDGNNQVTLEYKGITAAGTYYARAEIGKNLQDNNRTISQQIEFNVVVPLTLTYDANDATSGSIPAKPTKYASGAEVTVLGNTGNLAKTGYSFNGWNTKADGTGTHYGEGETFNITADTTLYAQWEETAESKDVTFDWNHDNANPKTEIIKETIDGTYTLPKEQEIGGYTFDGWFTDKTEGGKITEDTTVTKEGPTTLYAHWLVNVAYKAEEHVKSAKIRFGSQEAKEYTPDKDGYLFVNQMLPIGLVITMESVECDDGYVYNGNLPEKFTIPAIQFITHSVSAKENAKGYTIADILPDDFPTKAEDGWENENSCRISKNKFGEKDGLMVYILEADKYIPGTFFVGSSALTKSGNDFVYYEEANGKITFCMNGDEIKSIKIEDVPTACPKIANGTYKPVDPKPVPTPDPTPSRDDDDHEPLYTGTWNAPVKNGSWTQDKHGIWHYASSETFRNTWGYILNPFAKEGQNAADWFWFDKHGNMLTGWQSINGKWYFLNPTKDGTLGACQLGGVTPDGWTVDESGAWIESIPRK